MIVTSVPSDLSRRWTRRAAPELNAGTAEVLENSDSPLKMRSRPDRYRRVSSGDPGFLASKLAEIKRRGNDVSAATTAPGDKVVRAR